MNRLVLVFGLLGTSCTPSQIIVRKAPPEALDAAQKRLESREVVIDPAGQRADRLRTATFCYPVPNERDQSWDASFGRTRPGPVRFSAEGPMADQDKAVAQCPFLFQVEVEARPTKSDALETELVVHSAWWRAVPGKCAPVGDPLTGIVDCEYSYVGATGQGDVEGFFYGLLNGL